MAVRGPGISLTSPESPCLYVVVQNFSVDNRSEQYLLNQPKPSQVPQASLSQEQEK